MYSRFRGKILNFLRIFLVLLLWGMCISIFLGVIFRFIIKRPLVWSEEFALLSMVWLTFIGASVIYESNDHLNVDLLLTILPNVYKERIEIIAEIMVMPFFIVLVIGGYNVMDMTKESITPALNIPVLFQYLPAFIGGILLLWFNIERLIVKIKNLK